ncbi:hypothetical protein ACWEUT_34250, partial [Actinomadura geliboluensis]
AGTGADRQRRAAARGGPRAVVEMLARQTEAAGPPVPEAPPAPPGEEPGVWDACERVPEPDAP